MAKAHGIDLSMVSGSGPGGRIVRADVLKAIEKGVPAKAAPAPPAAAAGELLSAAQEIPIAGVRKVVFKNMHLSLATQAQLTCTPRHRAEGMSSCAAAERRGAKVSYNAVLGEVIARP